MVGHSMDEILYSPRPQATEGTKAINIKQTHEASGSVPLQLEPALNPPDSAPVQYPPPQPTPSPDHFPAPPQYPVSLNSVHFPPLPMQSYFTTPFGGYSNSPPYSPPISPIFTFPPILDLLYGQPNSKVVSTYPLRKKYSRFQVSALKRRYARTRFLTPAQMSELGQAIWLEHEQVKTWFQNQRLKERKKCIAEGKPMPLELVVQKPKPKPKPKTQLSGARRWW